MGYTPKTASRSAGSRLRRLAAVAVIGTVASAGVAAAAEPRPFGDARVLSQVPTPPGFPEGIAVQGKTAYVAGPATFGTIGKPPSRVVAFSTVTGAQVGSYPTAGENVLAEHANSSVAFDGEGRLYVLNTQLGLYRLTPSNGKQEAYGKPFPDLPPCILAPAPCSPTPAPTPPLPNDLVFDGAGNAYVTDSLQATIWKVPAGGGQPEIWFQDSRLASPYIGVNGIRLDPSRTKAFLTVTTDSWASRSSTPCPWSPSRTRLTWPCSTSTAPVTFPTGSPSAPQGFCTWPSPHPERPGYPC